MATALNPNKTDFSMSLGLSAHVVYVWGQYEPVISGGVIHFKLPLFSFSSFISLHGSRGDGTAAVSYEVYEVIFWKKVSFALRKRINMQQLVQALC